MGFLSMTKTSTKTWNWNLLPLLAFAAMGISTSGCGNGLLSTVDDGAAGTGSGSSGGLSFGGSMGSGGSIGPGIDGGGLGGSAGSWGSPVPPGSTVMFLADDLANTLYRYSIAPNSDPTLNATIPVQSAESVALSVTGEMFVASYSPPALYKLTSPFGSSVVNGPLAISGISVLGRFDVRNMAFVDDDFALTSPGMLPSVSSFDAQGTPGISWGMMSIPSGAGILGIPMCESSMFRSAFRVVGPSKRTASPVTIP